MPFDFDRIIDQQLYLATQQCIHPYAQQRRVSSAPAATTAAAAGPARTAGGRKLSLGALVSPWGASSGGSSNSSSWRPRPSARQGYSPVDLFFTAPVGIPARGGGGLHGDGGDTAAQSARDDDSSSSLDHFVTAPVGDFATSAPAVLLPPPPLRQRGNDFRPGSSDTDNWSFATASAGSDGGTFSGLETTVDLTPSPPPPSLRTGKTATHISTAPPEPPPDSSRSSRPGVNKSSAITLQVQDLQRTKRFYERVFGARYLSSEDGKSTTLSLNNNELVVTLRESPPDAQRVNSAGVGGILLTVHVNDVGEVCRRLRGFAEEDGGGGWLAGQRFAEPVSSPGGVQIVTFCDPTGYCWQVRQDLEGP